MPINYIAMEQERNQLHDMLLKLYKQVTRFNIAHPTLRVCMSTNMHRWYEEEIKEKEND